MDVIDILHFYVKKRNEKTVFQQNQHTGIIVNY